MQKEELVIELKPIVFCLVVALAIWALFAFEPEIAQWFHR